MIYKLGYIIPEGKGQGGVRGEKRERGGGEGKERGSREVREGLKDFQIDWSMVNRV